MGETRTSPRCTAHNPPKPTRLRILIAALLALLLVSTVTACASGFANSSSGADKTTAAADTAGSLKLCGTPPCTRFMSRHDVKKLNTEITEHRVVSAVVWKLAFGLLCGGLLCLLGEGMSYEYVQNRIHEAAGLDDCLRVQINKSGPVNRLIMIGPSNLKPYCKN
jgi:hypothetical protein